MKKRVAVIGGGAAGFFFAANLAELTGACEIVLFEKTSKLLSKVKVSGGGRCNVTNAVFYPTKLAENYPRGKTFLKKVFEKFSSKDTIDWFARHGVTLKSETDNRIFPITDSSQTIIDCFLRVTEGHLVDIRLNTPVNSVRKMMANNFLLNEEELFDYVFVASGGNAKKEAYSNYQHLNHSIELPVPSLFTFNIPFHPLKGLEGISVPNAGVKIAKWNLQTTGALLVTHWGLSGSAVLKFSAWGARELADKNYVFTAYIHFLPQYTIDIVRTKLLEFKELNKMKVISVNRLFDLPSRLWERLVQLSGIIEDQRWLDITNQKINKLSENICNLEVQVSGKTTFKEEFVTCGGISLQDLDNATMESKQHQNLFFGGEVIDVDGITGGFNFQAAWSTSWLAADTIAERVNKDIC